MMPHNDPNTIQNGIQNTRRLRLQTLIRLRWLAVAGQSLTVFLVTVFLDFTLPLLPASLLILALAGVNVFLSFHYPRTHRLVPTSAFMLSGIDLVQLCALLFLTGGLANPFVVLVCVPVIISFASQPIRYSLILMIFAATAVTLLAFSPFPLPWYRDHGIEVHPIMQFGIWCSTMSTMIFAAAYAYRVSSEASQLADALAATELMLEREKHLSQLDGLAAAAAHELGTPLATISVVAKEMQRELQHDERFSEDVALLRSQSERCRDILKRLTTLSPDAQSHLRHLPFSSMIEDIIAPHREFGIDIEHIEESARENEPVVERNAGIMYGIGNLIENAVDYAHQKVTVTVRHDAQTVSVVIEDDGKGYAPDILRQIGDPYVTNRQKPETAGGLGLGLFIAKTLLERSGASLVFENREDRSGARIRIEWRRFFMDADLAARP